MAYKNGDFSTWLLIPGQTIPVCYALANSATYEWIYDSYSNILDYGVENTETDDIVCRSSWLSLKLSIRSPYETTVSEYIIDDFIQSLQIVTKVDRVPTLNTLFSSWCAYTQNWFPEGCDVRFNIIDDQGEDSVLTIADNNEDLIIKNSKIYVFIHERTDEGDDILRQENNQVVLPPSPTEEVEKKKED